MTAHPRDIAPAQAEDHEALSSWAEKRAVWNDEIIDRPRWRPGWPEIVMAFCAIAFIAWAVFIATGAECVNCGG